MSLVKTTETLATEKNMLQELPGLIPVQQVQLVPSPENTSLVKLQINLSSGC